MRIQQLSAALCSKEPTARFWNVVSYALIVLCCAPTLFLDYLPMRELPQYAALSRILLHLDDAKYGFSTYYELDFARGGSVLPLWLWGGLADVLGLRVATRLVVFASLLCGQLGLCAVLRAQHKPALLALLGLPFVYSSTFYQGLVPCAFSLGLGLFLIAWLLRLPEHPHASFWLAAISFALPLTHPAGLCGALLFTVCYVLAHGRGWGVKLVELWPLMPLAAGALYWVRVLQHADGVAGYHWPDILLRVLYAPQLVLGGFAGRGEAWLLLGALVVFLYLCRSLSWRELRASPSVLCCWWVAGLCLLGYMLLPSSNGTASAICERIGASLLAWLPVLIPSTALAAARQRGPLLLVALAVWTIGYTSERLWTFSAEAAQLDSILAKVPERPKLLSMAYDSQGTVARSNPYVHIAAYAQAERGGFLSLSRVDYAWTTPLRRRKNAPAPAAVYGSEWDPAALQLRPDLFEFYNSVLTIGKEPREMTILMQPPFRIAAQSGMFVLYEAVGR
jgi:hypothetical protein